MSNVVKADFNLELWQMIGGEGVFIMPLDKDCQPCDLVDSVFGEAYNYNHAAVDATSMLPFPVELWDQYAICYHEGKICSATTAMNQTGSEFLAGQMGYFGRNPTCDIAN